MKKIMQLSVITTCCLAAIGCGQEVSAIESNTEQLKPVHVIKAKNTLVDSHKTFHGTVQSQERAALSFRIPGTLQEVLVNKGELVTKGQVIARLDQHDYSVALQELEARKLEAISAHKLAKAELARVEQALEDNAIASVNKDRAVSGYERSLSAIKVIDKNIERANDTLRYTEIIAPFDGVISQVNFDSFEQVLPGIPVVTLQNNQALEVDIDVPDTLISQFSIGQLGEVTWYQSDNTLPASLTEISTEPDSIRQTYTVTYAIDTDTPDLLPGRAVTLRSMVTSEHLGYCLPYSALLGEKNNMYVNVVSQDLVVKKTVDLTQMDARKACVKAQFNENDYVVISGSHYLHAGQSITNLIVKNHQE